MKVLIIEDDKLLAESLRTLLELKGFEVEAVYDGEDALSTLRSIRRKSSVASSIALSQLI